MTDLSPFRTIVDLAATLFCIRYSYFDPADGFSSESFTILDPADPLADSVNPDRQARIDGWPENRLAELATNGIDVLQVHSWSRDDLGPVTYQSGGDSYTGERWSLTLSYRYTAEAWLTADWAEDNRVRRYFEFASPAGDGSDWAAILPQTEQDRFGFRLDEGPAPA